MHAPLIRTTTAIVLLALHANTVAAGTGQWSQYGGAGGQQYSSLDEIKPDNLQRLSSAWTARTGELGENFADESYSFQANPVMWNGTLYLSTATAVTASSTLAKAYATQRSVSTG